MLLKPNSTHGGRIALWTVRANTTARGPCRLPGPTTRLLCSTTTQAHRRRRDATPPRFPTSEQRHGRDRDYATAAQGRPKHIAVLGGGLTGLSTAWYLTKFMPEAKVTIYEGSGRYGGWIDTERVGVTAADGTKGTVVFERGARLVQPKTSLQNWDDLAYYELLTDIEPDGDGWGTGELYDRYFYYPDHLVRLPKIPGASDPIGMIQGLAGLAVDLYREPLYKGALSFLWNLWRGKTTDGKRPGLEDVSIGEEVLRRGGRREPVDNMLSAMCHGIYGGDVWKLSAESSIIGPYFMNQRLVIRYRSHWQKWTDRRVRIPNQDADLLSYIPWKGHMGRLLRESMRIRALNLGAGFGTLTDGIVEKLKANANVKFVDEKVTKLRLSATGRMEATTPKRSLQYDKVISTLYSKTLASLAPHDSLPSLAASTAVTIRLVNLWSPTPNLNYRTKGFGYLIPQTVPAEQNPHAALGVIFDSDRTHKPDVLPPSEPAHLHPPCRGDTVPGTKFTVMLGGHHWDGIPPHFLPDAAADDAAAVAAAKDTLRIQMGIPPEAWQVTSTKLCVDCIPQHLVGHAKRMEAADAELRRAFAGRLAVAGGSYTAPGVVGSVRAARDVAWQVSGGFRTWLTLDRHSELVEAEPKRGPDGEPEEASWTVGETGLARFVGGTARHWVFARYATLMMARTPTPDEEGPKSDAR